MITQSHTLLDWAPDFGRLWKEKSDINVPALCLLDHGDEAGGSLKLGLDMQIRPQCKCYLFVCYLLVPHLRQHVSVCYKNYEISKHIAHFFVLRYSARYASGIAEILSRS